MLSGGSGRFPNPEKREPAPKGQCPVCNLTVPLIRNSEGILTITVHATFLLRCTGSGSAYPGFGI